ncbi:MAG: hypothetical protein ACLUEQ_01555 [Cloacibacillus evryensis]
MRGGRLRVVFKRERRRDAALLLALFLCAAVQGAAVWHIIKFRPNIIDAMYDRLSVCAWVGTATFHWWDFFSLTRKALKPQNVSPETVDEIADGSRRTAPCRTGARARKPDPRAVRGAAVFCR